MTDPVDYPDFMLLVPVGNEDLTQLLKTDPLRIRPLLDEWGVRGPIATANLGEGRMVSFGMGCGPVPNRRAHLMLEQWYRSYFELSGPVIFSNISPQQAISLIRVGSLSGVQGVLT